MPQHQTKGSDNEDQNASKKEDKNANDFIPGISSERLSVIARTGSINVNDISMLQRTLGNHMTMQLLRSNDVINNGRVIQRKDAIIQRVEGEIQNFRTKVLQAGNDPLKAIHHELEWESSTGNLADLAHIQTREHIWWDAPNEAMAPYIKGELGAAYANAGEHFGLGGRSGDSPPATDDHAWFGPVHPSILDYNGDKTLTHTVQQEYQWSAGDGNWTTFDKSHYTIVRSFSPLGGGKMEVRVTKYGVNGEIVTANMQM